MKLLILSVLGFLLGSIPTGQMIAQTRGIDLKKVGSGNTGATNVLRSAGRWPAFFTLAGDILKGAVAALAGEYFFPADALAEGLVGLSAVLGHNFSVFLNFKGGKGVASSLGMLLIYSPTAGFLTIIIWLMTALLTRYSSLGALVSFGLLPFSVSYFDGQGRLPVALALTALLFVRHRDNISRLLKGTEAKIGGKA